jgi:hypothetical protein
MPSSHHMGGQCVCFSNGRSKIDGKVRHRSTSGCAHLLACHRRHLLRQRPLPTASAIRPVKPGPPGAVQLSMEFARLIRSMFLLTGASNSLTTESHTHCRQIVLRLTAHQSVEPVDPPASFTDCYHSIEEGHASEMPDAPPVSNLLKRTPCVPAIAPSPDQSAEREKSNVQ